MEPDSPVSEDKTVKAEEGVIASNIGNTVSKCKELHGVNFFIFHGNPPFIPIFFCSCGQCKMLYLIFVKQILIF